MNIATKGRDIIRRNICFGKPSKLTGSAEGGDVAAVLRELNITEATYFKHNSMTFYVQAPIFVFREFMRHRIASYNEESGRYRELLPVT